MVARNPLKGAGDILDDLYEKTPTRTQPAEAAGGEAEAHTPNDQADQLEGRRGRRGVDKSLLTKIPADQHRRLKLLAIERDVPMHALQVQAIEELLNRLDPQ